MTLFGRTKLRSLDRHLAHVKRGAPVVVGLTQLPEHQPDVRAAGFSEEQVLGERVLPAVRGPVSDFNAEGGEIVHKDQPMETAYREFEWEWKEWDGTWHSKTVYQAYQRYPRTKIEPPSVELSVQKDPDDRKVIVADALEFTNANSEGLLHRINLFRELFGEATPLTENLDAYSRRAFRRLNWEVLPAGEMPWERLSERLEPHLDQMGDRKRPVAERRLALFTDEHTPNFAAAGRAGFSGYLVFGYEGKDFYVLESLQHGNATYVFGEDWERLSQMTKAEVLSADLQRDRLIHRDDWEQKVRALLA